MQNFSLMGILSRSQANSTGLFMNSLVGGVSVVIDFDLTNIFKNVTYICIHSYFRYKIPCYHLQMLQKICNYTETKKFSELKSDFMSNQIYFRYVDLLKAQEGGICKKHFLKDIRKKYLKLTEMCGKFDDMSSLMFMFSYLIDIVLSLIHI